MTDEIIVDVRDAHYAVRGRTIFSGLSLQAMKGQITAVMGPSGTGKTTLLRLITAQIYADRGEVMVFGENLAELNSQQIFAHAQAYRHAVPEQCAAQRHRCIRKRSLPAA